MSGEIAFATVKFVAVIITGIWAVIGLQVDYKDKDGRITAWGRRALFWSVISALIAVGAQALETINKRREDEASAEKTRNLLIEIRRAVYPIQNIYVTTNLIVPRASLPAYAAKLDKASVAIAKAPSFTDRYAFVWTGKTYDDLIRVKFSKASTLYPTTGSLERNVLVDVGLRFCFFKKAIDVKSIVAGVTRPGPDLEFLVRPTEAIIDYQAPQGRFPGRFQTLAMNMEANAKDIHWLSNGKIASLLDLNGAQLIVSVDDSGDEDFKVARSTIQLLSVDIDIGGRRLFIGSGLAKAPKAYSDSTTYCFSFPQNVLEADEYLGQDKSANDKIRARAFSTIEMGTQ